jgi:hypothetical protein
VKTKVGQNWYQLTGIALVLGSWTFFFNFLWAAILDFAKKRFAAT